MQYTHRHVHITYTHVPAYIYIYITKQLQRNLAIVPYNQDTKPLSTIIQPIQLFPSKHPGSKSIKMARGT